MIEKPGVYQISLEDYHADPCIFPSLSRSTIVDLIFKSPLHAWVNHPKLNPEFKKQEPEKKFDLGSAAHSLFLEGVDSAFIVDAPDWRGKKSQEARDKAYSEGKIPLLLDQYERVEKMVHVAHKAIWDCDELKIGSLNTQGESEQSYIWEEDGIWMRVRPDWISEDKLIIIDYKTTSLGANPNDLSRQIINMGYDIQAAFYSRGTTAIHGIEPKFIFLFQETSPPYCCSFIGLPPDFIEMAKSKVEYGIFLWRECLSQNRWSGYPSQVCWVSLPPWASVAWEQRAAEISV